MTSTAQKTLFTPIADLEMFFNQHKTNHRFVGGVSFGGLLNGQTTWDIDIKKKEVHLHHANRLEQFRPDGTEKDIDVITLAHTNNIILSEVKNLPSRTLSVEPTTYFPQTMKSWKQFVTSLYVDQHNQLFLVFGSIKQRISWESIEAWHVFVDNEKPYTVRNPLADYYAYQFRSPAGIKPKDEKKLMVLKKLADDVLAEGKKQKIDYLSDNYFGTWQQFIINVQTSRDPMIITKKIFMKMYWGTIGETLAHGKGIGKLFINLQNKFTG